MARDLGLRASLLSSKKTTFSRLWTKLVWGTYFGESIAGIIAIIFYSDVGFTYSLYCQRHKSLEHFRKKRECWQCSLSLQNKAPDSDCFIHSWGEGTKTTNPQSSTPSLCLQGKGIKIQRNQASHLVDLSACLTPHQHLQSLELTASAHTVALATTGTVQTYSHRPYRNTQFSYQFLSTTYRPLLFATAILRIFRWKQQQQL